MTDTRLWDRAAVAIAADGRRSPAVAALPVGLPTIDQLFDFMRDAELRFETLRMRVVERDITTKGDEATELDVILRHPGSAKVMTIRPDHVVGSPYEIWISDGEIVRTYSAAHKLGTSRPVRNRVRGLDPDRFPGRSTVYDPITPLPMETLAELFVHPAGYAQNVLTTGECWISGTDRVAGREAIVLECDHPRSVETTVDRPDYHVQVSVDRQEGLLTRLVESVGDEVTRVAEVTYLEPDAALPATTFDFEFPEGTTVLY